MRPPLAARRFFELTLLISLLSRLFASPPCGDWSSAKETLVLRELSGPAVLSDDEATAAVPRTDDADLSLAARAFRQHLGSRSTRRTTSCVTSLARRAGSSPPPSSSRSGTTSCWPTSPRLQRRRLASPIRFRLPGVQSQLEHLGALLLSASDSTKLLGIAYKSPDVGTNATNLINGALGTFPGRPD